MNNERATQIVREVLDEYGPLAQKLSDIPNREEQIAAIAFYAIRHPVYAAQLLRTAYAMGLKDGHGEGRAAGWYQSALVGREVHYFERNSEWAICNSYSYKRWDWERVEYPDVKCTICKTFKETTK